MLGRGTPRRAATRGGPYRSNVTGDCSSGTLSVSRAHLHIHTSYSDGLPEPEATVNYAAACTQLQVIAITDHDTLDGAWQAHDYCRQHRDTFGHLEVIIGEEVSSHDGHILGLFLRERAPPGMSADDTIRCHYLPMIGRAYTFFEGSTAQDLRAALLTGAARPGGGVNGPLTVGRFVCDRSRVTLPTRTGRSCDLCEPGSMDPSSNSHHERMEASCPLRRLEAWKPNRLYSQPQYTKERTDSYS